MAESSLQLVNKVTYTASLITDVAAVDPMLDTLRRITARVDSPEHLSQHDRQELTTLQFNLEEHIVKREKVRYFTSESLQLQIQQHFQGENMYIHSRRQLQLLLGITILIALLTFFVPLSGARQHTLLASTTSFGLIQLSAAWLFFSALKSFQAEARKAYILICTGLILLGVCVLPQPLVELLGLHGNPYVSAAQVVPVFISSSLLYAGIYRYAKLVGVKSRFMSRRLWLAVAAGFTLFTFIAPHVPYNPWFFYSITTAYGWLFVQSAASAALLFATLRSVPDIYKPPVRTFLQAGFVTLMATAYLYGVRFFVGPSLVGAIASIGYLLLSAMSIMLMRAGYTFNKVSRY
jgi:hypothetical protein